MAAKQARQAKAAAGKTSKAAKPSGVVDRLRAVCLAFPGTDRDEELGNPTFKAKGKSFAVLDRYKGEECIWFRCAPAMRDTLLKDDAFFAAPYDK